MSPKRPTSSWLTKKRIGATEHPLHREGGYEKTMPISAALKLEAHKCPGLTRRLACFTVNKFDYLGDGRNRRRGGRIAGDE